MADFHQLATRYVDVWNETDPDVRRKAVESLFTTDAHYIDPLADVEGTDAIDTLIRGAQQRAAGMRFSLVGPVDGHHDQLRFSWELGPAGGEAPIAGFDVVQLSNGKIRRVLGFIDRAPS